MLLFRLGALVMFLVVASARRPPSRSKGMSPTARHRAAFALADITLLDRARGRDVPMNARGWTPFGHQRPAPQASYGATDHSALGRLVSHRMKSVDGGTPPCRRSSFAH